MAIIPSSSSSSKPSGIVTPEQKKQKKLLIIFGIVILITAVFLYYNYSSSPAAVEPAGAPMGVAVSGEGEVNAPGSLPATGNLNALPGQQEEIPSLQNVRLDFSVFDSPRFVALKEFTDKLDISSIEKGRRNPFVKY